MAIGRAEDLGVGLEHVAPERGQGALRADAGKFLEQRAQQRTVVAPVGERGEAGRQVRIARQIADQPVAQRKAVFLRARGQHLDLHLGHVDAGRAFMAAGLAGDAEFQRLHHLVGGQRVRPELAGDRQPQRVGAAARDILLVAGRAIGRAHHAALELPAGAVVVAHLDRALKAAAGAGIGRPVERGLQLADAIVRRIAKQRTVVHFGRIDDLAGIEQIVRIEALLDLAEIGNDARAEHRLVKFGAHQPVAMLAGMRALVFAHHLEGFFGDGAHRLDVLFELQIEHRAHMQAAFGGVRIHGAAGAVLGEDGVEPLGIVGEMRQRHRAILDKGDRLALLLHRHHDVEAGGAEIGDRRSAARVR